MDKLLKESPFSLVKFQVHSKRDEMKFNDRRLNRVRNKNRIPFGPWARSVTESTLKSNMHAKNPSLRTKIICKRHTMASEAESQFTGKMKQYS